MRTEKTLRQLNRELSKIYDRLRPQKYRPHWADEPENRRQIDALLDKKYVEVTGIMDGVYEEKVMEIPEEGTTIVQQHNGRKGSILAVFEGVIP